MDDQGRPPRSAREEPRPGADGATDRLIKCVVWDLDDTIWEGVLLEDPVVRLRPGVSDVIRVLDERGILHSIASRNDSELAMRQLRAFGLADFFLYPQITWSAKSASIQAIARSLNIGVDSLAFVDDQPFECEEVAASLPQVLCLGPEAVPGLPGLSAFSPRIVSEDARGRRQLIRGTMAREAAEAEFQGPTEAFLASLRMVLTIGRARESDLRRAEELTLRTNQLNTTGYTYTHDELAALSRSPDHLLLMAGLEDKYGTYGRIGLALVECRPERWTIKLLLMSCRVMSRGVGSLLLGHVLRLANQAGVRLRAEFIANGRNRMMLVTYRLAGFRALAEEGSRLLLEHDPVRVPEAPDYVRIQVLD